MPDKIKKEFIKNSFLWRERRADLRTDDTKLVRIARKLSKLERKVLLRNFPSVEQIQERLVYRIIDGSTVYIRLISLTRNSHSLQRFHRDEFRSLYLLFTLQEKVCSFVRRTDCCFRKLFIDLICRSLNSCQNPQLA